jgi:hypothetical protein
MSDHAITHDLAALARLDALGVPKREQVLQGVHGDDAQRPVSDEEQRALVPFALAYARLAARRAWGIAAVIGVAVVVALANLPMSAWIDSLRIYELSYDPRTSLWNVQQLSMLFERLQLLRLNDYASAYIIFVIGCALAWRARGRALSRFTSRVATAADRVADAKHRVDDATRSSVAWWTVGTAVFATCFGLLVARTWFDTVIQLPRDHYVRYEACCGLNALGPQQSIIVVLLVVCGFALAAVRVLPLVRNADVLKRSYVRWSTGVLAVAIAWWCRAAMGVFTTLRYQLIAGLAIAIAVVVYAIGTIEENQR